MGAVKPTGMKSGQKSAPLPWRLLGASALLALSLPYFPASTAGRNFDSKGRARLTDGLQGVSGWQAVVDVGAIRPGDRRKLFERLQNNYPSSALPKPSPQLPGLRLQRLDSNSMELFSAPLTASSVTDRLFYNGPVAVGEGVDPAGAASFELHGHAFLPRLYSGRVKGRWQAYGSALSGQGFKLQQLGPLPAGVDRLLSVDSSVLSLAAPYRDKLDKAWRRWEFATLDELSEAFGPNLTYLRWNERTYFSLAAKQPAKVSQAIAKRFPSSLVPTSATRVEGTRIQGFDPDGPSWAQRGDYLFAVRSGGTSALGEYLTAAVKPSSGSPSPLWRELERLTSTEAGWHLMAEAHSEEWGLSWAAALRWPNPGEADFTGFLVVEVDP